MMYVQEQIVTAFDVLPDSFLCSPSKIHQCHHQTRTTMTQSCILVRSFFSMIESMNDKEWKMKKRRKKEERTWRSSVTQGYTLNVHIDAIALNSCSNGSLSSTNRSTFYSQKNNLFPFDSFYLMLIPRWLHRLLFSLLCFSLSPSRTHFYSIYCSNTHLWAYTYEEITLNGPWTIMMVRGTRVNTRMRVKLERERGKGKVLYIFPSLEWRQKQSRAKPVVNKKRRKELSCNRLHHQSYLHLIEIERKKRSTIELT